MRTLTYNDWETNQGVRSHQVLAIVTPTVMVSCIILSICLSPIAVRLSLTTFCWQERGAIHYGCDNFLGAELETQVDFGLAPSHWESRTFGVSVSLDPPL